MLTTNLFQIGSEVCSKRTGNPTVGYITAILDPLFFIRLLKIKDPNQYPWSSVHGYIDWMQNSVYAVKYKEPQRPFSYQEFLNGRCPSEELLIEYQLVPFSLDAWFPERDLELFDATTSL